MQPTTGAQHGRRARRAQQAVAPPPGAYARRSTDLQQRQPRHAEQSIDPRSVAPWPSLHNRTSAITGPAMLAFNEQHPVAEPVAAAHGRHNVSAVSRAAVSAPPSWVPQQLEPYARQADERARMRQRLASQADALNQLASEPSQQQAAASSSGTSSLTSGSTCDHAALKAQLAADAQWLTTEAMGALDEWIVCRHTRGGAPRRDGRAGGDELKADAPGRGGFLPNQWLTTDPIGNRHPGKTAFERAFMKASGQAPPPARNQAEPASGIAHQWSFGALR